MPNTYDYCPCCLRALRGADQPYAALIDHLPPILSSLTERQLRQSVALILRIKPSEVTASQLQAALVNLLCLRPALFYEDQGGASSTPLLHQARTTDPDFWHYTGARFRSKVFDLTYSWRCVLFPRHELPCWSEGALTKSPLTRATSDALKGRFENLARRAVRRLGLEQGDALGDRDIWLDVLRQRFGLHADTPLAEMNNRSNPWDLTKPTVVSGSLHRVIELSGLLCDELAHQAELNADGGRLGHIYRSAASGS